MIGVEWLHRKDTGPDRTGTRMMTTTTTGSVLRRGLVGLLLLAAACAPLRRGIGGQPATIQRYRVRPPTDGKLLTFLPAP